MDSFYIGAYWGSRTDSLVEVTVKTQTILQKLSKIDAHFLNWYKPSTSREKALRHPINYNSDGYDINQIILNCVKKNELNSYGIAKYGFVFNFWSGHKEGETANISFSVGMSFSTQHLSNCCLINLPDLGDAHGRLLKLNIVLQIMDVMIEEWDPEYCVLTSKKLRDELNVGNQLGWVTYRKNIEQPVDKIFGDYIVFNKMRNGQVFHMVAEDNLSFNYSLFNEIASLKNIL